MYIWYLKRISRESLSILNDVKTSYFKNFKRTSNRTLVTKITSHHNIVYICYGHRPSREYAHGTSTLRRAGVEDTTIAVWRGSATYFCRGISANVFLETDANLGVFIFGSCSIQGAVREHGTIRSRDTRTASRVTRRRDARVRDKENATLRLCTEKRVRVRERTKRIVAVSTTIRTLHDTWRRRGHGIRLKNDVRRTAGWGVGEIFDPRLEKKSIRRLRVCPRTSSCSAGRSLEISLDMENFWTIARPVHLNRGYRAE